MAPAPGFPTTLLKCCRFVIGLVDSGQIVRVVIEIIQGTPGSDYDQTHYSHIIDALNIDVVINIVNN